MKITPLEFKMDLKNDGSRSGGLHLSDVIRDVALRSGILDSKYAEQSDDDQSFVMKVSLGLAWEDWLAANVHRDVCYHPGETMVDGISMSPDGVSFSKALSPKDDIPTVHEFKLTWKSMKRDISGEWMWLAQIKGYCHAMKTTRAVLHVYWVNGDYSHDGPLSGPQYRMYGLEFTLIELSENWRMITGNADQMTKVANYQKRKSGNGKKGKRV